MTDETLEPVRPIGETWLRASSPAMDVSYPQRTIELVVIPYDVPADVLYQNRRVQETIARGAFDGIERRANRVRVNREHQRMFTIGRATTFHPSREEGLVARVKVARTELGDETLELAGAGCLDASAGFLPMTDGLEWLTRTAYRVTRGWLEHIALTPEPAYAGHTPVLSVRARAGEPPASKTPNLDTVLGWRLEDRVASDPALQQNYPPL